MSVLVIYLEHPFIALLPSLPPSFLSPNRRYTEQDLDDASVDEEEDEDEEGEGGRGGGIGGGAGRGGGGGGGGGSRPGSAIGGGGGGLLLAHGTDDEGFHVSLL